MNLKLLLFAGLTERFAANELHVNIDNSAIRAGELLALLADRHPVHADLIRQCFIARNHTYAQPDDIVGEGDELALIPPVSGGQECEDGADDGNANGASRFVLTDRPLDVDEVLRKVLDANHGASLVFVGTTRKVTDGRRTVRLEYESYGPMALKSLEQIEREIRERWPGTRCAVSHRTGPVGIGEISVVIAVSAPHRDQCYAASRYAIEKLKQVVPIWKKEVWEDGAEWKGRQGGPWNPL